MTLKTIFLSAIALLSLNLTAAAGDGAAVYTQAQAPATYQAEFQVADRTLPPPRQRPTAVAAVRGRG